MRNGVGFAKVGTRDHKAITYNGNVVVLNLADASSSFLMPYDSEVDEWVANNFTWGDIKAKVGSMYIMSIGQLRFDDGNSVTIDDCILYTEIPDDADMYFVLEPGFYLV